MPWSDSPLMRRTIVLPEPLPETMVHVISEFASVTVGSVQTTPSTESFSMFAAPTGPKFSPTIVRVPPAVVGGTMLEMRGPMKFTFPIPLVPVLCPLIKTSRLRFVPVPAAASKTSSVSATVTVGVVALRSCGTPPILRLSMFAVPMGPKLAPDTVTVPPKKDTSEAASTLGPP